MDTPKRIGELGKEYYVHACKSCGGQILNWSKQERGYVCKECKDKEREEKKLKQSERTFDIAVTFLRRKKLLERYEQYLPIIEKNLDRSGWFQSSPEIICALELLANGIKARHQVKMGRWRVDFVIPDMKIVLEIDGAMFHQGKRAIQDEQKDAEIIAACGPEWEVIRVPDTLLKTNPKKLLKAIDAVKKRRKEVRESWNHVKPKWHTGYKL